MKKILFTIDTNTSGGAERVISLLANWFSEKGYDTTIINSDTNSSFYPINSNVKIVKLKLDEKYQFRFGNVFRFISKERFIKKYLKSHKPDAVITFLINMEVPTIIAALLSKTKVYTSIRNSMNYYSKSIMIFRRIIYPRIAGVVLQSKLLQEDNFFKRINTKVISNPLVLREDYTKDIIPLSKRKNWIIAIGRLTPQKNQHILIEAFCRLADDYPDLELHIFGEGELKIELQKLIDSTPFSKRIVLEGNMLDALYIHRDSKLFVLSSNYEGFPNALVEAMAYGIPVISSNFDTGVAEELIREGVNGDLFSVGNVQELSEKIRHILNLDSQSYYKMIQNEMTIIDKLSIDIIANQWEKFIF